MSTFEKTKVEETKALGQEKAGQAQSATGTAQGDATADAGGAAKTKTGEAANYAKSIAEEAFPKLRPEDAIRLDYSFIHENE